MNLGNELVFKTTITHPGRSSQINYTYKIPAGSYVSVNTIAGNVSQQKLTALQAQLTQTKTILQSNDPAQIQSLTRETILGDMFYTGTLGYFAQLIGFNHIGALQAKAQYYLSAGYGTFGYEPKVDYLFGLASGISAGGVALDIPTNVVIASNTNNQQEKINFKLQAGITNSALEHIIPEQLFNVDPLNPLNGFSAAKGLQIAAAEGQRIYQISQANVSSVMPNINLDAGSEAEILQAINAGKTVIAHTDPVSVPGYTGAGYIIFDPATGDGAYKISGGLNGGLLALFVLAFIIILALFFLPILAGTATAAFLEIALVGAAVNFLNLTLDFLFLQDTPFDLEAAFAFVGLLGSIVSVIAATTITAAVLPLISTIGFAYYISTL